MGETLRLLRNTGSILIVDDQEHVRRTVRHALEDAGHAVIEANHGQDALHFLATHASPHIDLILLDLVMPIMDGWQFLRLMNSYVRLGKIPVLIVSAYPPRLSETQHSGIVGVLHSPYAMEELLARVDVQLSGSAS